MSGRKNIKRYFKLVLLATLLALGYNSMPLAEDEAGRENLFLMGVDARALGMGGAFVSVSEGASSVHWNPAGLALMERVEATFLHVPLWEETNYDFVGLGFPFPNLGSIGLGAYRLGTTNIDKRDLGNLDLGSFDNASSLYSVSIASSLPLYTKVGASCKVYNQSIDGSSATGVGLDFGILVTPTRNFSWGVNVQDLLQPKLRLQNQEERIPYNLKTGASFQNDFNFLQVLVAVDLDKTKDLPVKLHVGGEVGIYNTLFLRGGFDRDYPTVGAGLNWSWARVDYALKFHPDLGNTSRFSLSIPFGKSRGTKPAGESQSTLEQVRPALTQENEERIEDYLEKGKRFEGRGDLLSALESYNRALGLDDKNEEALAGAASVRRELEANSLKDVQEQANQVLVQSYVGRAQELCEVGNYKLALEQIAQALSIDSLNSLALELKENTESALGSQISELEQSANQAFQASRVEQAMLYWTRMLELDSTNSAAKSGMNKASAQVRLNSHFKSGVAYFNSGNYSAAQVEFQAAFTISPQDQLAADYLRQVRAKMEKTTNLEDLKKDPQIWEKYQLGLERFRRGDYPGAIQAWDEVLRVYPNNRNTLRNIALARSRSKK